MLKAAQVRYPIGSLADFAICPDRPLTFSVIEISPFDLDTAAKRPLTLKAGLSILDREDLKWREDLTTWRGCVA